MDKIFYGGAERRKDAGRNALSRTRLRDGKGIKFCPCLEKK